MNILEQILEQTRHDLALRDLDADMGALRERIAGLSLPRDFAAALRRPPEGAPRIIAELKKASPSRGLIRADFQPSRLAAELESAGAAALSVLTEPCFFQGSGETLREAAAHASIPILRKDFIVADVQLLEARAWGASAVLLIAAALSPWDYARLYEQARGLGLGVLTEVHDAAELDWVLSSGAHIIGVNSRDLTTFKTDLRITEHLLQRIPDGCVRVAESGIRTANDMQGLMAAGADAFLIGETLMRAPSPGQALSALLNQAQQQQAPEPAP